LCLSNVIIDESRVEDSIRNNQSAASIVHEISSDNRGLDFFYFLALKKINF